jgi:hypothetical protein
MALRPDADRLLLGGTFTIQVGQNVWCALCVALVVCRSVVAVCLHVTLLEFTVCRLVYRCNVECWCAPDTYVLQCMCPGAGRVLGSD